MTGWKCCKPRVLTFDEFLSIPPCTTGKHSTVDETPAAEPTTKSPDTEDVAPPPKPIAVSNGNLKARPIPQQPQAAQQTAPAPSAPPPESESDDPSIKFDEFMKIEGCKRKKRHMFVGSGKEGVGEEALMAVRHDFYQTPTTVIASLYLKKIDKQRSKIEFASSTEIVLDLPTTDMKRYKTNVPLFGQIDTAKSTSKIMGTKLELTLVKLDSSRWPTLRSDEQRTSEITQVGPAGRA
ncbi:MAG: hypothetical protein Q9166_000465 [cf. Caloplaca sp. 2 TL-2023]